MKVRISIIFFHCLGNVWEINFHSYVLYEDLFFEYNNSNYIQFNLEYIIKSKQIWIQLFQNKNPVYYFKLFNFQIFIVNISIY